MEAVGRLAGGIAHNFNNLLTVIMGHCDVALTRLPAGDPARANLARVRQAAERSAELTRPIRASGARQMLRFQRLDLDQAVPQWAEVLRPVLGEAVHLVLEPGPGPHIVEVDPGQIEQAVLNLVLNAREAMPEGGTLTIATTRVDF